jgi:23S rRNA pseudouridine1911/1915/1917 synthase
VNLEPDRPVPGRSADETVLHSRVPPAGAGLRLVDWLERRFRYLDRDGWQREIAAGRVQLDGRAAEPGRLLRTGDLVAYRPPHEEPRADTAIEILHDDADIAVVFKPAHLVAHADGAFVRNTFFRVLERHYRERGERPRLQLAHRLDRETSGLLVVAKNPAASRALQRQFEAGTVHKEYLAVVHGVVGPDQLDLDGAIGRDAQSAVSIRRAVVARDAAGARPARTLVRVERRFAAHTLVRALPETGRTHQIRVHLAHAGHPVVGDKLYGRTDDEYLEYVRFVKAGGDPAWDGRLPSGRQLLHAGVLAFAHPTSGAALRLAAPQPPDMAAFVAALPPG